MMPITKKKVLAAILTAIAALCLALAACGSGSFFLRLEAGSAAESPGLPGGEAGSAAEGPVIEEPPPDAEVEPEVVDHPG